MTSASAQASWPKGFTPGGWVLGPLTEPDTGARVRQDYRTVDWFAERVGMSHALQDLRRVDGGIWVCDPAILIGPIPGWVEEDVIAWGMDNGLLDEDGKIKNARDEREQMRERGINLRAARKRFSEPLPGWRRVTRVYLNQVDLGHGLGVTHATVIHRKRAGRLPTGAVRVREREGWADEQMRAFAAQMTSGWTTPDYIQEAIRENEGRLI